MKGDQSGSYSADVSRVRGVARRGDKVERKIIWLIIRRGWKKSGSGCVPEKIRMVSIPERKLDSASSCGGLGVVDLEGIGVMDLENPFSLESFDSAERERERRFG